MLALCAIYFLPAVQSYANIPSEIYVEKGIAKTIDLGLPMEADVDSSGVVSLGGETLAEATGMQSPLVIQPVGSGDATIELKLFGVSVKTVKVSVSEERMVIPGGQSIGVTLFTRGALVVGITGIELENGTTVNPAREAGMLPGDVITRINGTEVSSAADLTKLVNAAEGNLDITVDRSGRTMDFSIQPVRDYSDGKLRLGLWVRDDTAGVGTLTFIDPNTRWFAGLGHAITDIDTGSVLSVRKGEIYFSEIIQINKGESGIPGEIQGFFSSASGNMGHIVKNTDYGIYGTLMEGVNLAKFPEPIPVAHRDEVELGEAEIISTIDHEGARSFSCEIVKLSDQSFPGQKGIVIRITDAELLDRTGGIVQGMSGSPIVQNGKLVGAVTHVFVNNPTKGYGLYADWMLEQLDS
jgi:stage IV sporulation protein B